MLDNFLSGCVAGAVGAFSVLPIDITRTRVQCAVDKPNPLEIIRHIWKFEGFRGFYKGGTTQVMNAE